MPVATQKAPFEVKGFLLLVGLSLLFQAVGFIDPTQIHSTDLRSSSTNRARTKERRAKAGYAKMHLLKFKSSVIWKFCHFHLKSKGAAAGEREQRGESREEAVE